MMQDPSQMEMFDDNDDIALLKKELHAMRKRCDLLRRRMSSHYNKLAKLCIFLKEENSTLRKRIDAMEKIECTALIENDEKQLCNFFSKEI